MRIMVGFQAVEDTLPLRRVSRLKSWRKIDYDDPGDCDYFGDFYCLRAEEMNLGPGGSESKYPLGKAIEGSGCGLEIIDKCLTRLFRWLGTRIGEHPSYYIIIPLFLSLLLGTGMQRLIYVDDPEYLFSPVDGLGKFERELIEKEFPMNYSSRFNPSRFVRAGRFAR